MSRDEITARVARYAEVVSAPVTLGTEVQRLTPINGRGFQVTTSRGELSAGQVVVATGAIIHLGFPTSRSTSLAASRKSIRMTTGTRLRYPQARCSSSGRD